VSDNWLKFVPTDPDWQPSLPASNAAVQLLMNFLPEADEIASRFFDNTVFVDPGENWAGVRCPRCGNDIEEWWGQAMAKADETTFQTLEVDTSCCGSRISLNDLHYIWPAGFGRFVLWARNPNVLNTTEDQDCALAQALGHKVRKIWAHI
jgi:hypothetical protein